MTYSKGDQVLLVHRNTEYGSYGIADEAWGLTYTVTDGYANDRNFVIQGHGKLYAVWDVMVEHAGGPW